MHTRIKCCAMTRVEDALFAAKLGVDAIGLIFYPPSARHVNAEQAQAIVKALPPFVTVVGVFVDANQAEITRLLNAVNIDVLQFHGSESAQQCRQFGKPYIKVIQVGADIDITTIAAAYPDAQAILLDTHHATLPGGSGVTFDWQLVPALPQPVILAGGLNRDNVQQAIKQVQPYAVDVVSGIERAQGSKDLQKMTAFVQAVRTI